MDFVNIIGGGLAGCEAAWQLAERGIRVKLYEMRPLKMTPAHKTPLLSELVCSNSFRSDSLENASGMLKEELAKFDSLIIKTARKNAVPAGKALAVDRNKFPEEITRSILNHDNIEVIREEVENPEGNCPVIIASGPLTSDSLASSIKNITGEDHLYFYDAAAPIVTMDSIDFSRAFWASRYDKGESDYLNSPLNEEEYSRFYDALITAETFKPREFEREIYFEGCMPIEVMARRGFQTLLYGPLKPVGLVDPFTGKQPFAVVQLRRDNASGSLLNLVGFQTSLKKDEQEKIIRMLPGLENADIARYGAIHRNTYINSPKLLKDTLQLHSNDNIFFAGQITGAEGYLESTSTGLVAGINCALIMKGEKPVAFPETTGIGALSKYITDATNNSSNFQPMNINFGLLPPLSKGIKNKKIKKEMLSTRSLQELDSFKAQIDSVF